ncbi:MAG TPA: arylsulfotransferase family protein [Solirubrobacteraceae bacterium]|nr:arylsulfotransferase family protein [Solirubrobacteraceae bacterium]
MRTVDAYAVTRAGARTWLGAVALAGAVALFAAAPAGASPIALSPLNGTLDASPQTQISVLGVPASEITDVSVAGSSSGRHAGRLESYESSPGASFLPAHPFTQGERVTASALIGPRGHSERVSTSFTVARLSRYSPPPPGGPAPAKPGTTQSFVSEPTLHPPTVAITTAKPQATPGDVFITPTHGLGQSGPMIINEQGGLVWYQPLPTGDVATNLKVQSYKGQRVLTWWQGHIPAILGVGFGTDEIYSSAYTPIATVSAGNGYEADLHAFQITPSGSAFLTAYSLVDANLASVGGASNGTLQDALLQEIDVPTGLVMFEWHAYGHVELHDSYSHPPRNAAQPWDFFHLNSISIDPWGDGNFIVSSRNTWAAYEISHHTGQTLWRVGGKRPSFKMGAGTGTAWQHNVRWQPDHTLTAFDDGAAPKEHSQSRVIRERIDWAHRTVTLLSRDVHTPTLLAGSQGNDQVLANGNSFVGWGEEPYFTEFGPTGQILFDAHLPAPGQSYRAYEFPWSATPAAPPAIAVQSTSVGSVTVYASWNGATGVSGWRILDGGSPTGLVPVATAARTGFETAIPLPSTAGYFAVQALSPTGQVLGTSPTTHP